MRRRNLVLSAAGLAVVAGGGGALLLLGEPESARAADPPPVIRLVGKIRDFRSDHPDFDIDDSSRMGHYAWNVSPILGAGRRPEFVGGGSKVVAEWFDKDLNPIAPYAGDRGLPGGHFDVDVFDEATDKQLYHQHKFDDKFDVTYVDLVDDPKLLYDDVIGPAYPNDLRLEFFNSHHGSGTYTFQAGASEQTGSTQGGFETTFSPAALTRLRVDFASLMDLRMSSPGDVQRDVPTRNDAFSIRLYDTTTDALVYELAVYHHAKEGEEGGGGGGGGGGKDACDAAIVDTVGRFGAVGDGAIAGAESFGEWFRDVLGTNLSNAHTISLYRDRSGVYEYLTDAFFPIDGQLLGNEGDAHNDFFTYAISATFTYESCAGQFFEFEGNDDCWVFIDDRRVIDLGGVATPARQYVALDRLEMVDGERYRLDFFFAHRRDAVDSVFRMRTNILLETPTRVPVSAGYD